MVSTSSNIVPYVEDYEISRVFKVVNEYRPRRTQRYSSVHVLILLWEDGDRVCHDEAKALSQMFRETFNYDVEQYQIPSKDSQRCLVGCIGSFVFQYGGEDNLILVHYGGHGGRAGPEKLPFTWAAHINGGPTLDWSLIQPGLLAAGCDVVLFLDCCYAGQAARPHSPGRVELLAATDKDQWTAMGIGTKYQSFTAVLIKEIRNILQDHKEITIPTLQRRMAQADACLARQPFYVALSDGSAGKIVLQPWSKAPSLEERDIYQPSQSQFILRLSMFQPMDSTNWDALTRWMTKDSPSSIENIALVEELQCKATLAEKMGAQLLRRSEAAGGISLPPLSQLAQTEIIRLVSDLKFVISRPSPHSLDDEGALEVIKAIKNSSIELVNFIEDSLAGLDRSTLKVLNDLDAGTISDLASRIAVRLALLSDDIQMTTHSVAFADQAQPRQRFRFGKQGSTDVLVEYMYFGEEGNEMSTIVRQNLPKVSALLEEPKSDVFRVLPGRGYLFESLEGPRAGFIYEMPAAVVAQKHIVLAELIKQNVQVPQEVRQKMASALCNALLHFHSIGWFHKGIKISNVLFLEGRKDTILKDLLDERCDFERPYLIGFDFSRPTEAETWSTVDFNIEHNLYRHPERWGSRLVKFERYHDLYALGILLLEIGCWRTLSSMDPKRQNFNGLSKPEYLREFLLTKAHAKLAHAMGSKYADAVKFCWDKTRESERVESWHYQQVVRKNVLFPLQRYN